MTKRYVKNTDEEMYEENEYDENEILKAKKALLSKKKPTSVALDEKTINELKTLAKERGIPYQVLMRSYILKGLKEDKKLA